MSQSTRIRPSNLDRVPCPQVRARAHAGTTTPGDEAHALSCVECARELGFVAQLEAVGRVLRAVPQPALEAMGVPMEARSPTPSPVRAWTLSAGAALALAMLLIAVWPSTAPRGTDPSMRPAAAVARAEEALPRLWAEVNEIRAVRSEDGPRSVHVQWNVPSATGLEVWSLRSTPLEEWVSDDYQWLSAVLSGSTL